MAVDGSPLRDAPRVFRALRRTSRTGKPMLNRSAVVIGHEPAFYGWLKTTGKSSDDIETLRQASERVVYLIPACHFSEEIDKVVEDLFQEIFVRELRAWQPNETHWPDTADFALFTRWFTVDGVSAVDDIGRGTLEEEHAL
jgi:hypothetical protein